MPFYKTLNYLHLKLFCFCGLKCIGVENVPASYVVYEGMQLTFRAENDNLDLGWTENCHCILRSPILDEREPTDTGITEIEWLQTIYYKR